MWYRNHRATIVDVWEYACFAISRGFTPSWEVVRMLTARPRARRYKFTARIEMIDVQSEQVAHERTLDVSLYGCRVLTKEPFPPGTKMSLRIIHKGESFTALGKIAYCGREGEIGIAFTRVEANDQAILEKWVEELRNEPHRSMKQASSNRASSCS
jgi:hypothetical protein